MAKKHNARIVSVTVLQRLLKQQGSLASELSLAEKLDDNERRLAHELCYGVCRWYFFLEKIAEQFLSKPLKAKDNDIRLLILLGIYQLQFTRIAPYAIINETVNCASFFRKLWAKKLINAVLRSFQRKVNDTPLEITETDFKQSHPQWLQQEIQHYWPQQAAAIFKANNDHPPMTLRVNQQKITREKYQSLLNDHSENMVASETPYSPEGLLLDVPVPVSALPHFEEGYTSVQDEAAQLAADLLQLQAGQHVLDACCAPGGKTCHIAEKQPDIASLTAVDLEKRRLQRVHENLLRLHINAKVICGDVSEPQGWWDGQYFDRILLDAPCSATGVIRRHPDIKLLRSKQAVTDLAQLQLQLLEALWLLLAEDGILLYVTCSVLPVENTQVMEAFVASKQDVEHDIIEAKWGLQQPCGRQLLPQYKGHDGFYYARLKKRSSGS